MFEFSFTRFECWLEVWNMNERYHLLFFAIILNVTESSKDFIQGKNSTCSQSESKILKVETLWFCNVVIISLKVTHINFKAALLQETRSKINPTSKAALAALPLSSFKTS